jgi:hypothetical protein
LTPLDPAAYAWGFVTGSLFAVAICYREVRRARRRARDAENACGALLAFTPDARKPPDNIEWAGELPTGEKCQRGTPGCIYNGDFHLACITVKVPP